MKVTAESDHCPEAATSWNLRTVSCPQDRLRTGELLILLLLLLPRNKPPTTTTTVE
jgi:hypothetical protein